MTKYRCPKFGCNGIGLPAGTRKPFRAGKGVVGDTAGYMAGGSSTNMFLTAFGYRGRRVLTFECQKCGRKWGGREYRIWLPKMGAKKYRRTTWESIIRYQHCRRLHWAFQSQL